MDYAKIKAGMAKLGVPMSEGSGFSIEDTRHYVEFAGLRLGLNSTKARMALAYPAILEQSLATYTARHFFAKGELPAAAPVVEASSAPSLPNAESDLPPVQEVQEITNEVEVPTGEVVQEVVEAPQEVVQEVDALAKEVEEVEEIVDEPQEEVAEEEQTGEQTEPPVNEEQTGE